MIPLASTPVNALPALRADALRPHATPTAVSELVVAAADAEFRLLANLFERVSPSVVYIDAVAAANNQGVSDAASGSGFVIDTDGHIVTNAHVVQDAADITVTFQDGYVTPASLVGLDVFTDVAVVRVAVELQRLVPVSFGDSDSLRVGERAIAIGNPFGLSSSMTVGIISGLGRQLPSAELMGSDTATFRNPLIIQVDAVINPGSSGGPLLNSYGQVIGITTAIRSDSGMFEGVGLAVPANTVQRVVPELITSGRVEYAWLGFGSAVADQGFGVIGLAEPLDLAVQTGVLVAGVAPGSPAAEAGLRGGTQEVIVRGRRVCAGGDIILAINDVYVHSMAELLAHLMLHARPGETITLKIAREDFVFDLPVTLEGRPTTDSDAPECGASE